MVNNMTKLYELKPGDNARIVAFINDQTIKHIFALKGLHEGSILKVVSVFGLITFTVNNKIFTISQNLAKKVRVILVKEVSM